MKISIALIIAATVGALKIDSRSVAAMPNTQLAQLTDEVDGVVSDLHDFLPGFEMP